MTLPSPARRIAFLTPEYPSEGECGGGLAAYLGRVTRTLVELGHEPEVFTWSAHGAGRLQWDGVRVQRVARPPAGLGARLGLPRSARFARGARALASALARRQAARPFDAVQSSNFASTGLFVPRVRGRRHLVRSSSITEWMRRAQSERVRADHRAEAWFEAACMRRADVVYAPSRLGAEYWAARLRRPVALVRPPFRLDEAPEPPKAELPRRYLAHLGNLGRVKGSDVLAAALVRAWRSEPELSMVWAGPAGAPFREACRAAWGTRAGRVLWLAPLPRAQAYGLLAGAAALVAPSRCDNLPNVAMESLALGVPVIGTRGTSLEELVEPGRGGELVDPEDAEALAASLVRAWRGGAAPFDGRRVPLPGVFAELEPRRAAARLLELVA